MKPENGRSDRKLSRLFFLYVTLAYALLSFAFIQDLHAQMPPCAPMPDNCICYGDAEIFTSDADASSGLQGTPFIRWLALSYQAGIAAPFGGNPTQSLSMANCGSPTDGTGDAVSSIVFPMSCSFNPCDEADLSLMAIHPGDDALFDYRLNFRFVQNDPISDHPSHELFDIPFVNDPAQYYEVNVPITPGGAWTNYSASIVNSTANSYDHVLIWFSTTDPGSCYTAFLDNVKLEITGTSAYPVPPLPIPETICKDAGCFDLTDAAPGVYSASGPGVAVVYDIYGNEHWRFCPDAAGVGTHTITICVSGGCCVEVTIEVLEGPSPDITGATLTTCIGEPVELCPIVGTGGPYTYEWASGETTECITITPGLPLGISTWVTATGPGGCQTTVTFNITVNDLPDLTVIEDQFICFGESVLLTASSDVDAPIEWYDISGILIGTGDEITVTPVALPETSVFYTVSITDPETGCTRTEVIIVSILEEPDMSEVDGEEFCAGYGYPLPNPSDCGEWTGPYVTEGLPGSYFFSPFAPGTYVLTYTTCDGCSATATVTALGPDFTIVSTENTCEGDCNGSVTLDSGGPVYDWDIIEVAGPPVPGVTITFSGLCAGVYNVVAFQTEEPFCASTQTFTISESPSEWPKTTSSTAFKDFAKDLCNDEIGNLYMVGDFTKSTHFDGLLVDVIDPSVEAMYLASYDQCGSLRWVASSHDENTNASRVAIDEDLGLVYVVGSYSGSATFTSGLQEDGTLACAGGLASYTTTFDQGAYVAVYNLEGCLLHVLEIPRSGPAFTMEGEAIAASAYVNGVLGLDHRVYVSTKQVLSDATPGATLFVNAFTPVFVAPYTFNFVSNWQRSLSSQQYASISDMEVYHGHLAFVGTFQVNLSISGIPELQGFGTDNDAFIYFWADNWMTPFYAFNKDLYSEETLPHDGHAYSVTLDNNAIAIAGDYTGFLSAAFDGLSLSSPFTGSTGGYVAKFNFPGTMSWISQLSSNTSASVRSLDTESGDLYIGGNYTGDELYIDGSLEDSYGLGIHTFVSRYSMASGPDASIWTNVSVDYDSGGEAYNRGLTYHNDHVYTCGHYSGIMDQDATLTTSLSSSPLGFQNAYLWRFREFDGTAKMIFSDSAGEKEKSADEPMIRIYPNPSRGTVQVEIEGMKDPGNLIISNILGEQVYQRKLESAQAFVLDVQKLPAGVYIASVYGTQGSGVITARLIIE